MSFRGGLLGLGLPKTVVSGERGPIPQSHSGKGQRVSRTLQKTQKGRALGWHTVLGSPAATRLQAPQGQALRLARSPFPTVEGWALGPGSAPRLALPGASRAALLPEERGTAREMPCPGASWHSHPSEPMTLSKQVSLFAPTEQKGRTNVLRTQQERSSSTHK